MDVETGAEAAAFANVTALPVNPAQNFKASTYERAADDWYVEPRWCVEQLADAIDLADSLIWDPACGGGTIPDTFEARDFRAVGSDIRDQGYAGGKVIADFLSLDPALVVTPSGRFSIVTNPPFRMAERFARHALALPALRVCMLQQLSFLASRARWALFREWPPSDVLILSQRPSMPPGEKIAEMGERAFRGGTTDFCWIVWTRPHDRPTNLRWLAPEARS
ncbi:hypothetical protein [Sphingomonas morindae]|uniref:Methyltransferase n=1 Tax=Sphingomonas morindae TaxID=1541170 RepID=A0ABY4X417_9SPHN|nr:hypothetical protein [Sphingomonas morindae]USI71634.1 hypothetical protein LHA26_09825 [Sphingomonas morindae]